MSEQIAYNFTTSTNFTFDSSKVDFTGSLAQLKVVATAESFSEDFADDTGFTYDSAKAEFTGGLVRQKDLTPANETFFSSYNSTINADRAGGSATGTAIGSPVITANKLDLSAASSGVTYVATSNAASTQTGCIRMLYTPSYSGTPGSVKNIFGILENASSLNNYITVYHNTDGALYVQIRSSAGAIIMNVSLGAWVPVSGTEYELELNFDLTAGATRLFLDGVQQGSTQTATGTRNSSIGIFAIGFNGYTPTPNYSGGTYNDVQYFSTVQHTSGYTPAAAPEYSYEESAVTLPTFTHVGTSIASFTALTATEVSAPKYVIDGKYWNGSAWVASDSSYAQANDKTTVTNNLATLTPSGLTLVIKAVFPSSNTQSSVAQLDLSYSGNGYAEDNPSITANSTFSANDLTVLEVTYAQSGSDDVHINFLVNGAEKYWTGAAWATSNGTYAQSSTIAAAIANIGTLLTGSGYGLPVKPKIYLHSADGSTTPTITSTAITYDFQATQPDESPTCVVHHTLKDAGNAAISSAKIVAKPIRLPRNAAAQDAMIFKEVSTTSDSNGQWDLDLIRSSSLEGSAQYVFTFLMPDGKFTELKRTVPDQDSISFDSLSKA